MRKFNKSVVLFGLIFCIMLIVGCVKFTTTPITPSQPSGAQEPLKEATPSQPSQATPSAAQPSVSPSPSTATNKPITDISAVKCDGQAYSLLVKPKHLIMWIMVEAANKQKILDLKSEGLIEEFNEVIMNDGASSVPTKQTYKGMSAEIISSRGAGEISVPSGWLFVVANLKVENADKARQRIQELKQIKVGIGYSGYGMGDVWSNSGDKDVIFEFKCRIPTGNGRIVVYSNIAEASFTATGPKSFNGQGMCVQEFNAPPGEYTFIFNDVPGYTSPTKMLSSGLKMTLVPEAQLKFGANYRATTSPDTGTIIVVTNLPEAKFTITGPASYSGSGTCWSQTNVPTGQYKIVFDDVPGYELSFFDKEKSIYVSSGFGLQTAEAEYKKIGEES